MVVVFEGCELALDFDRATRALLSFQRSKPKAGKVNGMQYRYVSPAQTYDVWRTPSQWKVVKEP